MKGARVPRIAVFSDLHLPSHPDDRNVAFAETLRDLAQQQITELWLLGDIFDLLVGPYPFWHELHKDIFAALNLLRRCGCRIVWLEGNHDFHLKKICEDLDIELYDEALRFKVGHKKIPVYLAHGDLVNTQDSAYLRWRAFTRNIRFRKFLTWVPSTLAERALQPLAEKLSHTSRGMERDPEADVRKLYDAFARERFAEGVHGVFLGHCHYPELLTEGACFYLNLGSWTGTRWTYALWDPDSELFPKVLSCQKMGL
ncbi:MAG: UDP-2,3-diacylglucosamine diphosphatase [Bdellovibrionales bacterium]|nr:UDP-2,3-diacylglucosamine diphosphatase [Bdellovibrionales bacterium]